MTPGTITDDRVARCQAREPARRRSWPTAGATASPGSTSPPGASASSRARAANRSRPNSSACGQPSCCCPRACRLASPARIVERPPWHFVEDSALRALTMQFGTQDLARFRLRGPDACDRRGGRAALQYARDTQKGALPHLTSLVRESRDERTAPWTPRRGGTSSSTRASPVARTRRSRASLTGRRRPMGARELRRWIRRPLRDREALRAPLRRHRRPDRGRSLRRPARTAAWRRRCRARARARRAALGAAARPRRPARGLSPSCRSFRRRFARPRVAPARCRREGPRAAAGTPWTSCIARS